MSRAKALAELERRKGRSLGQSLFRAARLLNARALERVRAGGAPDVRPAHTALFPHLDLEGTRLTTLAARMGVTKQAVGQLVGDLERRGLVRRDPDPADRRARLVRFTGRGIAALVHGLGILAELEAELERALGRRRLDALRGSLDAMAAALSGD
jgi:DNA-binding MarR family transcriptional regulator